MKQKDRHIRRELLVVVGAAVVLVILYAALNTRGTFRFEEPANYLNYNMLAEAFLSGQVHLKAEVHPERARSAHPNDPELPYPYLLDAIIFQGRYFFFHNPFPALIHAAWIVMTGRWLPTGVVVLLCVVAVAGLIARLIFLIRERFHPHTPRWIAWTAVFAFCMSAAQLFMVSRPLVYHEAIVMGMLCVVGGSLLFVECLLRNERITLRLGIAGALFGLAVLCKVTMLLYGGCFLLALAVHGMWKREPWSTLFEKCAAFGIPIMGLSLVLLAYNYARFGSFTDFGEAHMSFAQPRFYRYLCLEGNAFRAAHIPYNLVTYLFGLPELVVRFPVVWLRFPRFAIAEGSVLLGREQVGSVLLTMPMLVWTVGLAVKGRERRIEAGEIFILSACVLASGVTFGMFTAYCYATARFFYEFTPLLFVPLFVALAELWERRKGDRSRETRFIIALGLFLAFHCLMGLFLGLNGMVQLR